MAWRYAPVPVVCGQSKKLMRSQRYRSESPRPERDESTKSEPPKTSEPETIIRTTTSRSPIPSITLPVAQQRRDRPDRPFNPLVRNPRQRRTSIESKSPWFGLEHRPYRPAREREQIRRGAGKLKHVPARILQQPTVYHVDFTADEVAKMVEHVSPLLQEKVSPDLDGLMSVVRQELPITAIVGGKIKGRSSEDIRNFCSDLLAGKAARPGSLRVLSLGQDMEPEHPQDKSAARISSLLLAREMEGNVGFGRTRKYENFQNEFKKAREDGLDLIAEFTNCAGDIETLSWVSDDNLICGTTAHSDSHNQQYNKPGNLLLCSATQRTLRAFPHHRIPRPLVEKGENSAEAMRRSQDPWLYSSVVSSDYDPVHKRAYTSSFDKTVKVWRVDDQGNFMELLATWQHEGNVNFVAAAKDGSGRVASAADVPTQALRIYTVNPDNIQESRYEAFSCSRTDASETDKWAYYPATVQWGKAPLTQHLLAVGYSPRSVGGDDLDIPEDKRNSGEITLWNADAGGRVPMTTATTANVFEVTWHPTLPRFICATSPCGLNMKLGTRTQIHLFHRDPDRVGEAYCEYQSLDCTALDINELTFMPNSYLHAYVTAACTDGKVYIWDTARLEDPVHVLKHGDSLEGIVEDRERLDTGVKFTAWASSTDRFYTGSSDGVVKVWNVRNLRRPYVRTLLEATAAISTGAFSPDLSKLAIGDATGRVYLFSLDKRDEPETDYMKLPGSSRRVRRPMPFLPHAEPPPPEREQRDPKAMDVAEDEEDPDDGIVAYSRRAYFETGQLVPTGNPVIGIVQGPNYPSSGFFNREAHEDQDPSRPLLIPHERQQRQSIERDRGIRRRSLMRLREPIPPDPSLQAVHDANKGRDFDVSNILAGEMAELVKAGALLNLEGQEGWEFIYEEIPKGEVSDEEG